MYKLLTGPKGCGKTTWVLQLATKLRAHKVPFFGVATPKIVRQGKVIGILVIDLLNEKETVLAYKGKKSAVQLGDWAFTEEGILLANRACDPLSHSGFTIIDEIGPLELRGEGFQTAWQSLQNSNYKRALVVVRPELVSTMIKILPRVVMSTLHVPLQ